MKLNLIQLSARNVVRQSKRSLMLGLAMSFAVLITMVLYSATVGMSHSVVNNFSQGFGGHLFISGEVVSESGRSMALINDSATLDLALASVGEDIDSLHFRSSARGTLSFAGRSISANINGVDFDNEAEFTEAMTLIEGTLSTQGNKALIIPRQVAEALEVSAGESILLKASTLTGQQNLVEWKITGIVEDAQGFDQVGVFATLEQVNELIDIAPDQFQHVNMVVSDLNALDPLRDALKQAIAPHAQLKTDEQEGNAMAVRSRLMGGVSEQVEEPWQGTRFEVTNLNDRTSEIMALVDVLNQASWALFAVILLIILVGINNSYRMVILERTKEIGTLRAMGAQRSWVFRLFVYEALLIAFLGSLAGWLGAMVVMQLLSLLAFPVGGPIQLFTTAGQLQFPLSVVTFIVPMLMTLLVAAIAVMSPARKAANMTPGSALRATA